MEFRILGPLEVLEDDRQIDLGGAKQRALLAVLLLHANEVVSTDGLFDALWEDATPETGRKALQVYVSQLRKAIGRERLQTRAPGYLLRVEKDELDLERFRRLAGAGEFAKALALWRGPPLSDFTYQRFAQSEIGRLEELRLACLEDRIDADLAAGRHAAVVGELEALVAQHPLRERLRAQLMLALYRSGRQAEALEAYAATRRALVDELGIEPGPELRELERAILRQDVALTFVALPEEQSDTIDGAQPTFVGRKAEVQELLQGLGDAAAGNGRLFLLVGEPGIGKSRLADEIIHQAVARRAHVMVGRCWEGGGAPAYWPWVQSIREYVRNADLDALRAQLGSGAVDVAQIVVDLRERLPEIPEPPALESESARFRAFDSTAQFLRNVAADRPLLLVLEDLHAADEPSLLLLRFVAAGLGNSKVLAVGTYRDVDPAVKDPLATTLSELARESVTRRLHLRGFAEDDVASFIELTAATTPSAELVRAIHDETEGNPLFVGEIVRLLASEGHLRAADGTALSTLGIPQGVREVIGRRLRRLTDECGRILTLASVLGREFRVDVLGQLGEVRAETLAGPMDEAVAARLLTGVPGSRGRLRFTHALIRDTLYDELTTRRRVQLHRRAGEVLEASYGADREAHLAELAHHFFEGTPGGSGDRAVDYARRAAEQAVKVLAYEEAARLYGMALEALDLDEPADEPLRCDLLLGLGEAQARAGDETSASATFVRAADVARSSRLPEQLARAALGHGGRFVWTIRGFGADPVPLLEDALGALGEHDSDLRARVLARLAGALRDQGEPARLDELSRDAVEMARRLEDPAALAYALDGRYSAIWGPDTAADQRRIVDEIHQLARDVGDRERMVQAHYYRAIASLELGQMPDVLREQAAVGMLVAELRQPAQRWYASVLATILALLEGRFTEAGELVTQTLDLARSFRTHLARGAFAMQSILLHRERGGLECIVEDVESVSAEIPTVDVLRCIMASLYADLGRSREAKSILDDLGDIAFDLRPENDKLVGWCQLSEVCASLGETGHAEQLYELLAPHADRIAICHPAAAVGSVSRYLGILARTLSREDEAERHFEHALEMNTSVGARPWVAHTQEDYARTLLARGGPGDRDKGQALLSEALATYRDLGMEGPLGRANAVAQ